jgi:hypothetical protein
MPVKPRPSSIGDVIERDTASSYEACTRTSDLDSPPVQRSSHCYHLQRMHLLFLRRQRRCPVTTSYKAMAPSRNRSNRISRRSRSGRSRLRKGTCSGNPWEPFKRLSMGPSSSSSRLRETCTHAIRRDADEILIESPVVDRAKTETVSHRRLSSSLEVADDVSRIEQTSFLQRANRALTAVRRKDSPSEARLVKANPCLTHGVATFDRIVEWQRSRVVYRSSEGARRDHNRSTCRVVRTDVARELGLVPARARPDEIHDRDLELVRGTKSAIVWLIDVARAVGIHKPVLNDLVVVGRFRRGLYR